MIDLVLKEIVRLLNNNLTVGSQPPEVVLGNLSLLDAYQETSSGSISDKVVISVVNIQQDGLLRNTPANRQIFNNEGFPTGVARNPGIYLNVFLLIGANNSDYETSLLRISRIISFFQNKSIFTNADISTLNEVGLDKIIFDLYSTTFEELNQLWGIMGGKYIPSVLYKMRLAYIDNMDPNGIIQYIKSVRTEFNVIDKK